MNLQNKNNPTYLITIIVLKGAYLKITMTPEPTREISFENLGRDLRGYDGFNEAAYESMRANPSPGRRVLTAEGFEVYFDLCSGQARSIRVNGMKYDGANTPILRRAGKMIADKYGVSFVTFQTDGRFRQSSKELEENEEITKVIKGVLDSQRHLDDRIEFAAKRLVDD